VRFGCGVLRISSSVPDHPSEEDEAFRIEEDERRILLEKVFWDKEIWTGVSHRKKEEEMSYRRMGAGRSGTIENP